MRSKEESTVVALGEMLFMIIFALIRITDS